MKEIKLKECPCCGGEAEVKDIKYKSMPAITWVECKNAACKQKHLNKASITAQKKKRRKHGMNGIKRFIKMTSEV